MPAPMPFEPPVTRATLPVKRFLLHSCHEHPPVIFIGTKLDALSLETEANSAFNRLDSDPG